MECLAREVEELEAIEAIYGYESFVPCAHLNFVRELVDGGTLDADTAAELPELFFTLVWPTAEAQVNWTRTPCWFRTEACAWRARSWLGMRVGKAVSVGRTMPGADCRSSATS